MINVSKEHQKVIKQWYVDQEYQIVSKINYQDRNITEDGEIEGVSENIEDYMGYIILVFEKENIKKVDYIYAFPKVLFDGYGISLDKRVMIPNKLKLTKDHIQFVKEIVDSTNELTERGM